MIAPGYRADLVAFDPRSHPRSTGTWVAGMR